MSRDYDKIATDVSHRIASAADRLERMRIIIDALWAGLRETGVSWVGFYVHEGGDELVLAAREPKPACSPIGLNGACGRVFTSGKPLVVYDVAELGENYIACDPRDRSEVVLPLFDEQGKCYGVLDLDSHEVDSFSRDDVIGLRKVLEAGHVTR